MDDANEEDGYSARSPRKIPSLENVYHRLFPRIFSFVAYRVGRIQDTEDVVSDVFMRVAKALPKYKSRGQSSLDAWVFKIALNAVNDFYRKNSHSKTTLNIDEIPQISSSIGRPEESLSRKERFRRLYQLLSLLAPREQEVILLRFFAELKNKDISEALSVDERTVSSYLCRGLRKLENMYVERYELEEIENKDERQ